jgi:UDP-N-acetylglucosamine acyltransferase
VLGAEPQDRSHAGQATSLEVGDRNIIREHVTIHRGTIKDEGTTRIGSDCLFMVGVHAAHDVVVGDHATLANGTMLAGHVHLENRVTMGGRAAIAPFVRVGEGAFVAAGAMVETDVPPFVIVAGDRARVRALNRVGLRRLGVPESSRRALAKAFGVLFRRGATRSESLGLVKLELGYDPYVEKLVGFMSRCS